VVILLSHLRFRAALGPARVAQLPLRLPLHPVPTMFAIVVVVAIALTTFWVDGLQYTLPTFAPMLGIISIGYWRNRVHAKRKAMKT